ncbi:MAG: hypothetical protein QN168_01220 [Armatimonadota bacterium]|nr:hypothetical protein [Armatimonadota bacterium]
MSQKAVFTKIWALALVVAAALVLALVPAEGAPEFTLRDFGHEKMKPPSSVSLLVITAQYAGRPPLAHTNAFYDELVFNQLRPPSVNGYFLENSRGRFFWSRAGQGIIGPLQLPAAVGQETNDNKRPARVIEAAVMSGFDFAPFDANRDGRVTASELAVLIIESYPSGAARGTDPACIKAGSSSVSVCVTVLLVGDRPNLFLLAHELSHFLGTKDLYGRWGTNDNLNAGCTLMGPMIGGADGRESVHLDPWHKLQLGWAEPRIRSLAASGSETLQANNVATDSAVILYDPARGPNEYFIVEYRAPGQPGFHYDRNVCGEGVAIWHVLHDRDKNPATVPNLTGGEGNHLGVYLEAAPTLRRGGNMLWGSRTTTPTLRWHDGSMTRTTIRVGTFNPGATSVRIEWITSEAVARPGPFSGRLERNVAGSPDELHVFYQGRDGAIATNWAVGPWQTPEPVTPPGAGRPNTPITVVNRGAQIHAFFVQPDGAIATTWSDPRRPWTAPVAITPPGTARADSPLAAVVRGGDQLHVFYIAPDGAVATNWAVGSWQTPFPITPSGAAGPGSQLRAVLRGPDQLHVFYQGPDGAIATNWAVGPWQRPFPITPPGAGRSGSPIAVALRAGQLHAFYIGPDGAVATTWSADRPWAAPFPITPPGAARNDSPLAAVVRGGDQLHIFYIGPDGALATNWAVGPWAKPFAITPPGAAGPRSGLGAVVRRDQLHVFYQGSDGTIATNWAVGPWQTPFPITPPGAGSPGSPIVAVTGR